MPLTTIGQTLDFLQGEYQQYRNLEDTAQAILEEYNDEVRRSVSKDEPHPMPLRTLYIDLAMHDEMVQHSRNAQDQNRERVTMLLRNKIGIQRMIKRREEAKETVVPDEAVDLAALECVDEPEALKIRLMKWIPEKHKSTFGKKLHKIWKKCQRKPDWVLKVVKLVIQECILLGMKSIEDFRSLVCIVECLMLYHELHGGGTMTSIPETEVKA